MCFDSRNNPFFLFFFLQLSVTLCNLGVGATFGESILHDLPRDSTVVTKTTCELLRVEQEDFRLIFEVGRMEFVRVWDLFREKDDVFCWVGDGVLMWLIRLRLIILHQVRAKDLVALGGNGCPVM